MVCLLCQVAGFPPGFVPEDRPFHYVVVFDVFDKSRGGSVRFKEVGVDCFGQEAHWLSDSCLLCQAHQRAVSEGQRMKQET